MSIEFLFHTCMLELPYPPTITSVALSSTVNAVDLTWIPGFDGNSPVLRFTIDFRIIVMGMDAVVDKCGLVSINYTCIYYLCLVLLMYSAGMATETCSVVVECLC